MSESVGVDEQRTIIERSGESLRPYDAAALDESLGASR